MKPSKLFYEGTTAVETDFNVRSIYYYYIISTFTLVIS